MTTDQLQDLSTTKQVTLLLTARLFNDHNREFPQSLSTQEFTALCRQLHDDGLTVTDLTGPDAQRIINQMPEYAQSDHIHGEPPYDNDEARLRLPDPDRLQYLLRRGLHLAVRLQHWNNLAIQQLVKEDERYPSELRLLHPSTMPPLLHYAGNVDLLDQHRQSIWVEVRSNEFQDAQPLATKLATHMETKPRNAVINLGSVDK